MKRRREDFRDLSDMTHYTRKALIVVLIVFFVIMLATIILVMR